MSAGGCEHCGFGGRCRTHCTAARPDRGSAADTGPRGLLPLAARRSGACWHMKQSYQDGHKAAHGDLHPSCRHEVCVVFGRWQANANSTVGVHAADSRDWSGDETERWRRPTMTTARISAITVEGRVQKVDRIENSIGYRLTGVTVSSEYCKSCSRGICHPNSPSDGVSLACMCGEDAIGLKGGGFANETTGWPLWISAVPHLS